MRRRCDNASAAGAAAANKPPPKGTGPTSRCGDSNCAPTILRFVVRSAFAAAGTEESSNSGSLMPGGVNQSQQSRLMGAFQILVEKRDRPQDAVLDLVPAPAVAFSFHGN